MKDHSQAAEAFVFLASVWGVIYLSSKLEGVDGVLIWVLFGALTIMWAVLEK